MYLLQKTLETYEQHEHLVGKVERKVVDGKEYIHTLLPVSHRVKKTQLEFTLNEDGKLINITCSDKSIIIPTTMQSSGRTSGMAPHALHDDLKNIAFDGWKLTHPGAEKPSIIFKEKKQKGETIQVPENPLSKYHEDHASYLHLLEAWLDYKPHWQVKAIYEYVKDNTIVDDLVAYGIFEKQPNFKYRATSNKAITNGVDLGKTHEDLLKNTIRFNVINQDSTQLLWEDQSLMKAYIDFYVNHYLPQQNIAQTTSLVTGETQTISPSVMKFIRDSGDGGKLISINASYFDTGFFKRNKKSQEAGQMASIGFVESEKAFAALKWLIERQAIHLSKTHKLLVWNNAENPVERSPFADLRDLDEDLQQLLAETEVATANNNDFTAESSATLLKKALYSNKDQKLDKINRDVYIARLDSFVPGRFYIREFNQMSEAQYIENIAKWHERGMWTHTYFKNGERKEYYGVPNLMTIVSHIASQEKPRDKNMEITKYSADLLACVLHDLPIPATIIRSLERRLCNQALLKVEEKYKWYDLQNLTCSLLKNEYGRRGEYYNMVLQKDITNRDYLYGRWLAAAHLLEEAAVKKANKDPRETNAMRYFSVYVQRPYTTLNEIAMRIQPYKEKLKLSKEHSGLGKFYENLMDEILATFNYEDLDDRPLSGRVHLGFANQRFDIFKNRKDELKEETADQ